MAKRVSKTDLLMQNNLELQKVLADLSYDLKKLTEEMSVLVGLLKDASKTLTEEKVSNEVERENSKAISNKVDTLIDQNKTIAKGILLMESTMRGNLDKRKPEFSY